MHRNNMAGLYAGVCEKASLSPYTFSTNQQLYNMARRRRNTYFMQKYISKPYRLLLTAQQF